MNQALVWMLPGARVTGTQLFPREVLREAKSGVLSTYPMVRKVVQREENVHRFEFGIRDHSCERM